MVSTRRITHLKPQFIPRVYSPATSENRTCAVSALAAPAFYGMFVRYFARGMRFFS